MYNKYDIRTFLHFTPFRFINSAEKEQEEAAIRSIFIEWAFESNITDHNEKKTLEDKVRKVQCTPKADMLLIYYLFFHFQKRKAALTLRLGKEAKQYDASKLRNRDLKRKLKMISELGSAALPEEKRDKYNSIISEMKKIYSTAKVPGYKDKTEVVTEAELREITAKSTDPEELEYYWTEWRRVTGREMRDLYLQYVELTNEAAK